MVTAHRSTHQLSVTPSGQLLRLLRFEILVPRVSQMSTVGFIELDTNRPVNDIPLLIDVEEDGLEVEEDDVPPLED